MTPHDDAVGGRLAALIQDGTIPTAENPKREHPFRPATWRPRFVRFPAAKSVLDEFATDATPNGGRITRKNLVELSRACDSGDPDDLVRLFVATMLWGSGTSNGRGPRYTAEALDDPRLVPSLASTREMVLNGDPGQAYVRFRSSGVGPAFYTKWFWAAGLERELSPMPLILDARVWSSLGALEWDSRESAGSKRWKDRYPAYLTAMEGWARDLQGVNDAEHLEQMLFQWAGG